MEMARCIKADERAHPAPPNGSPHPARLERWPGGPIRRRTLRRKIASAMPPPTDRPSRHLWICFL